MSSLGASQTAPHSRARANHALAGMEGSKIASRAKETAYDSWKSIQGQGGYRGDDGVLRPARDAVFRHAVVQAALDGFHAVPGSLEAHRPSQFLGLSASEIACAHGNAK